MNMNLGNLVRDQFAPAAKVHLGNVLGRQPDSLTSDINNSIDVILDGFTSVARDARGREVLYEAVRYCDEEVVENPAKLFENRDNSDLFSEGHNRLAGLVGIANKASMVEKLQGSSQLSQVDADNLLGYMTPGVMGVLKRQIEQGVVLDNPDGIGQMFLGEGDPTTPPPARQGANLSAANGGVAAMNEESDMSWLFRYALPVVLLGGLVLGGMKNCGNMAGNKIVAQQESERQLELDGIRAEADAAKDQVMALQSNFDASSAEVATLAAKADGLVGELELSKANTAELESNLVSARAEADAAKEQVMALQTDFDTSTNEVATLVSKADGLTGELELSKAKSAELESNLVSARAEVDAAKEQVLTLQSDFDASTNEVTTLLSKADGLTGELELSKANTAELENNLVSARAEYEAARAEATELAARTESLNGELEVARASIVSLEEEVSSANQQLELTRAQSSELNTRVDQVMAELQAVKALPAETSELQSLLSNATSERNTSREAAALLQSKLDATQSEVKQLTVDRDDAVARLVEFQSANTDLKEQLSAAAPEISELQRQLGKAAELRTTLQGQIAENSSARDEAVALEEKLAALDGELGNTINNRDALALRVEELMAEKDAAIGETVQLNQTIAGLTSDLEGARAAGDDSMGKLGLLNDSFNGLKSELGLVTVARDEASTQVKQLKTEVSDLKEQIVGLEGDLGKAQAAHDEAMAEMQAEREAVQGELDGTRTTLKSEIGEVERQRDAAFAKIEDVEAKLASLNDEKLAAQAAIDDLNAQAQTLQSAVESEQGKVSELQAAIGNLEESRMSLTTERNGAQEQITGLNAEIAMLQDTLNKEQGTVSDLKAMIADLDATKSKLIAEQEEATSAIALLDTKIIKSGEEKSTLVDANRALQMQLDDAAAMVQAKKDSTLGIRAAIEARLLEAGLDTATVTTIEEDSAVAIVLGSGDLYGIGSAKLSPQGNDILKAVGEVVSGYPDWRIDIEGHTDSQGIGASLRQKFPTNWELSSARASATVRYLNGRTGIAADKLSSRGFADTRPLDTNETAAGRKKNRRVEIILRQ